MGQKYYKNTNTGIVFRADDTSELVGRDYIVERDPNAGEPSEVVIGGSGSIVVPAPAGGESDGPTPRSATDDPLAGNADDVIATIGEIDDVDELADLQEAETAGKNRKTVLAAISARVDELADPGDD